MDLREVNYENGKVNVMLSLLNYASHHEDIEGSGGIAPRIFNVVTNWR
jgi:hypothetical protein